LFGLNATVFASSEDGPGELQHEFDEFKSSLGVIFCSYFDGESVQIDIGNAEGMQFKDGDVARDL